MAEAPIPEGSEYALCCTVVAHVDDVRVVKCLSVPYEVILTGSRDQTVKAWIPNNDDNGYTEVQRLSGPSHFISSLCHLPATPEYPFGVVLAGSHDCAIYGFSLESSALVFKLLGHSGPVCSLVTGNYGTIVSGSWDKTARVWLGQKCFMVLKGHAESVWAVELFKDQGIMLTGSADRTIRLWRSGKCEKIFSGHEDCVRGLAVCTSSTFLSCSNDCTVRYWDIQGTCLGIYTGHDDCIYSIASLNENGDFVTCSEDSTVKVWRNSRVWQTIKLPARTIWSVSCSTDEDIVAGCSDGTIRIFTTKTHMKAKPEEVAAFEEEIIASEEPLTNRNQQVEYINLDELPTPDMLFSVIGTEEGQTKLCREGDNASVFGWSSEGDWVKLGDVVAVREEEKEEIVENKEYDCILKVDIDGIYLDLPYNVTDNPWQVALEFLKKHEINEVFTDEIARFIIRNTPECAVNCCDVPSLDAFPDERVCEAEELNTYFPVLNYLSFDSSNMVGIRRKLIEFNTKVESNSSLSSQEIDDVLLLSDFPSIITSEQMGSLDKIMCWPACYIFPVLDMFRLAIRSEVINQKVGEAGGTVIFNYLLKYLSAPDFPVNKMLVIRIFCNFFRHESGEMLLIQHMPRICTGAKECLQDTDRCIQISVSTLFLNYAVALNRGLMPDYEEWFTDMVVEAAYQFQAVTSVDDEAAFRFIVCAGTLLQNKTAKSKIAASGIVTFFKRIINTSEDWPKKVCESANWVTKELSN